MPELTEQQREERRTQARNTIEARLEETWPAWRRPGRKPNIALAADIALDSLGHLAAEILSDGTMMRALTVKDGVATLKLEPATEIIKAFVASARGMLDGYGAENYVESEMTAPSISMDLRDGDNPVDSYTVTVQRREGTTPHQFRERAEAEVARLRAELAQARGAAFAEAADALDQSETLRDLTDDHPSDVYMVTAELRRMAAEAQQ